MMAQVVDPCLELAAALVQQNGQLVLFRRGFETVQGRRRRRGGLHPRDAHAGREGRLRALPVVVGLLDAAVADPRAHVLEVVAGLHEPGDDRPAKRVEEYLEREWPTLSRHDG